MMIPPWSLSMKAIKLSILSMRLIWFRLRISALQMMLSMCIWADFHKLNMPTLLLGLLLLSLLLKLLLIRLLLPRRLLLSTLRSCRCCIYSLAFLMLLEPIWMEYVSTTSSLSCLKSDWSQLMTRRDIIMWRTISLRLTRINCVMLLTMRLSTSSLLCLPKLLTEVDWSSS